MNKTKDFFLVLILSLAVLMPFLSGYPLLEPDEARYVEIPREMVADQDYVVPRLNGAIYIEKPPLFYWAQALAIKAFGIQEGAVRFSNALFAALTAAMVCFAGSTLYDRKTGFVSAAVLSSSLLFYAMSHFITLDMTLTTMLTGTLLSFLLGLQYRPSRARRLWFYAGYVFAALAVLAKGLVGLALPCTIVFIWLLCSRRWVELKDAYIPTGLCLFLMVALPWHILMQLQVKAFFDFYIVGQHFMRYTTMAASRYQPSWFFIPILFLGLLPWAIFYIRAIARLAKRHIDVNSLYLLIWAAVIFVFFSASHSKLVPYILPVMPPLALILGKDLVSFKRSHMEWGFTLAIMALVAGGAVMAPRLLGESAEHIAHVFWMFSGFISLTVIILCIMLRCHRPLLALFTLGVGAVMIFTGTIYLWSAVADRSIKPLAMIINTQRQPGDEVVAYGKYIQDLPVYTEGLVTLVDKKGELEFGTQQEDLSARFIDHALFLKRWHQPHHRMFVVLSDRKYQQLLQEKDFHAVVLGKTSRYWLITNE